jgi:hypothetical protein
VPGCHGSSWRVSSLTLIVDCYLATSRTIHCQNASAIDRIAALGAGLIGTDLADALEDFDLEALFGGAGVEAADRVRRQPIASAM